MRPDFKSAYFDPCNGAPRIEACRKPGRVPRDPDDQPSFEGVAAGRRRGWNRVERTQRQTNVLIRWLASRVGRRWDDVWSEACRANDARTVPGSRVRADILRQVMRDPASSDGEDPVVTRMRWWRGDFWVDAGGVLRERPVSPHRRRDGGRVDEDRVVLSGMRELRRIEGLWYEVTFVQMPPARFKVAVDADGLAVLLRTDRGGGGDALIGRWATVADGQRLAVSKNAMSRGDLRRHGLRNDPDAKPDDFGRRPGERH